jgi:hypothetical protein
MTDEIDYKAFGTIAFEKLGLSNLKTLIIQKQVNETEAINELRRAGFNPERWVIVRLSNNNELNKERVFFSSHEACGKYIQEKSKTNKVIVNELIDLENTIELISKEGKIYAEICPGIWETDNSVPKDKMVLSENTTIARVISKRPAKYRTSKNEVKEVFAPPYTKEYLTNMASKIKEVYPKLRVLEKEINPIFCKILEDSNGEWHFVNIRKPETTIQIPTLNEEYAFIRNLEDTKTIGDKKIVLDYYPTRENALGLHEMAKELSKQRTEIFFKGGILSHNAIILREYGLAVKPFEGDYEVFSLG